MYKQIAGAKYFKFRPSDRKKFLKEVENLSARAKNVLSNEQMDTWDSFYFYYLINHDKGDFRDFRNCGINTTNELISLMRKIMNPSGKYNKEIEKFDSEFKLLSKNARSVIMHFKLSTFEKFYYRYAIEKDTVNFKDSHNCGQKTLPEVEIFVKTICNYLRIKVPVKKPIIYFNPHNPRIPFIIDKKLDKSFSDEFANLSESTTRQLRKMGAGTMESFYMAFLSEDSQFNMIMKEIGEHNLSEILKLRSIMKEEIKQLKHLKQIKPNERVTY